MSQHIVNDVTGLNPISVWAIVTPRSTADVVEALKRSDGPVSIGGGRFSMGGQTASPDSLHLDMRQMNQVLAFSPADKTIRVQAGIRWCDIQRFVDPHHLSVKIMQTYANFSVGGSLSVNVHGRYVGLGPLILSVRNIRVVLADASVVDASPTQNTEIFYGAIGGYGGLGVITEAELELTDNVRVKRLSTKLRAPDYLTHFKAKIGGNPDAIFHNADLYPPLYERVRSVTWVRTDDPATEKRRLHDGAQSYALNRYFVWAVTETPFGKWRREYIVDPLVYARKKVHWRNFEASYDVAELEPASRARTTYVLQEYFVPVRCFESFVSKTAEILQRHRVNALNISVRHAHADPGALLAWAREESFAFVLYYKQRTRINAKNRVAVWTRELIDAAISEGGSYYLPYQPHATPDQFHAAFPQARALFGMKRRLDPQFRFRNVLWDRYHEPSDTKASPAAAMPLPDTSRPGARPGEFRTVFDDVAMHDGFYRFLQNVYRLYPEDRFHTLIKEAVEQFSDEEAIYRHLLRALPRLKPTLGDLTYALPALRKQKREMARQTMELLGGRSANASIDGYLEIGTTGRYISELRHHVPIRGRMLLLNDVAPGFAPPDIVERGRLRKLGEFVPLGDYAPVKTDAVADASLDLVACYIGLHHADPQSLPGFLASIARALRPGGRFILRDHDVTGAPMDAFVSLAHTVFNAGLGVPWETNQAERRHFAPADHWRDLLAAAGLQECGPRLRQAHDPSDNLLMVFRKAGAAA